MEWNETKHHIGTGIEASNYSAGYAIYQTEQQYRDEVELRRLNSNLQEAFRYYGPCKFTLDQLRAVTAILYPSKEAL